MFNSPPGVVTMYSLHVLITVYASDVYRLYKNKTFKQPPRTYLEGLDALQDKILHYYGEQVPFVKLVEWLHQGIKIPYETIQLLDDETLMEFIGALYTLPLHDPLRRQFVSVYLRRLINDKDIIQALTYRTLTPQQQNAYERLENQITGTRYDSVYVEYFKKIFDQ
tara:strand:- start:5159 stop:5656 length:498 start_codon:yes stop_codon:yes gene_type:complete